MARLPSPLPYAQQVAIFSRLRDANPAPVTELHYDNAFQLLVAVALSAQATDAGVNRATKDLFATVKTPQQMLDLGEDALLEHIKSIGLFRQKAKNVMKLSRLLVDDYDGQVPSSRAALMSLPGVGRKTANVVLNEAFGEATLAVDTHVFRVSHRIGLSQGKTPDAVERDLLAQVPPQWARPAHHLLILHGRYLCKARTPECWRCPIAQWCRFKAKSAAPARATPA